MKRMIVIALALACGLCGCRSCEQEDTGASAPRLLTDAGADGCPDPLFPLLKGARWTYEVSSTPSQSPSIIQLEVLETERTGRTVKASVRKTAGQLKTMVEASCSPDGTSFLSLFVFLGPPLPASLEYAPSVTKREGALVPPLGRLRPGLEWQHSVEAHTENPGGAALTLDSIWTVTASYLGERQVTVPAGTYDTRQVKLQVSGHHRPPEEEDVVFDEQVADPPGMTFTYSLAPGVGVVLIEGEPLPMRPQVRPRWVLSAVSRAETGGL